MIEEMSGWQQSLHDRADAMIVETKLEVAAAGFDAGIARYVRVLQDAGVETFESCEGGPGHCAPEPFVRFHGERSAGWRALCAAQELGLPVLALQREWPIVDGEPTGPWWRLVFRTKDRPEIYEETAT